MGYIHEHKVKIDPDDVHNVVDSDIDESGHVYRFIIDPITRQITHGSSKLVLTKLDHNSECFTFEIPKTIEGHDMSKCNVVEVHFINIDSETGESSANVYTVPGALTYDEDKEVYTFTWLISQAATQYIGTLNFAVRFACYPETEAGIDKTSVPLYSWRTAMFSGINIIDSVFSGEKAIADYSDILDEWWSRIESTHKDVYAITAGGAFVSLNELIDELQSDLSDFKDSIGSNFLTEESASEKYLAKTDAEDKYQPIEDQDLGTGDTTIVGAINEVNDAVNNIITGDTAVGNAVKLNGVAASEYTKVSDFNDLAGSVQSNQQNIEGINAFLKSGDETFIGFQGDPETVVSAINELSQDIYNFKEGTTAVGDANKLGGKTSDQYLLKSEYAGADGDAVVNKAKIAIYAEDESKGTLEERFQRMIMLMVDGLGLKTRFEITVGYETGSGTRDEQESFTRVTPGISDDIPYGTVDDWEIESAVTSSGYAQATIFADGSVAFYTTNGNSSSGACLITYKYKYL